MTLTEWLCGGERKASSNAGHVQGGGSHPPGVGLTAARIERGCWVVGWGVLGWRGWKCLYQSFTRWPLTPVPTVAANNWPEEGGPSWPAVYVPQPPTCINRYLLIFYQNGSYIHLTVSLPPQHAHDILQVSQSVSVSSNEISAFILHTPHLSSSKK